MPYLDYEQLARDHYRECKKLSLLMQEMRRQLEKELEQLFANLKKYQDRRAA